MEKIIKNTLPLSLAFKFGIEKGLTDEITEIKDTNIHKSEFGFSNASLRKGMIVELFENNNIFEEFIEKNWPNGKTINGKKRKNRWLNKLYDYKKIIEDEDTGSDNDDDEQQSLIAETDLRNVLSPNLNCIEQGLNLHKEEDRNGVEYSIDGGRIDILAKDKDGKFVVIELKLSKGREKVLGQLLYYMGWIDSNFGNAPCRGIIVAKEISKELKVSVQRVPGVSLYQYKLNVSVEKIS